MMDERWGRILRNPWAVVGGILGIVVLFGLGLFVWQVGSYVLAIRSGAENPFEQDRLDASVTQLLSQTPVSTVDLARIESKGNDPTLGNPDAKIRIVEFLDYECPFCKRAAPEVRAFMARHPDDVFLIIRDFPLETIHPNAMGASIAARCVFAQKNDDVFWRYHDKLFAEQAKLTSADLRRHAEVVGANLSSFDECIRSRAQESVIRASMADGVAAGVRGTPTFFVNTVRIQGALDLSILETIYQTLKKKI